MLDDCEKLDIIHLPQPNTNFNFVSLTLCFFVVVSCCNDFKRKH